jgi:hypothetical protein
MDNVFFPTAFASVFVVGVYRNVHQFHLTCCNLTKTNSALDLYGPQQCKVLCHFFGTALCNPREVIHSIWSLDFLDAVGFSEKSACSVPECLKNSKKYAVYIYFCSIMESWCTLYRLYRGVANLAIVVPLCAESCFASKIICIKCY